MRGARASSSPSHGTSCLPCSLSPALEDTDSHVSPPNGLYEPELWAQIPGGSLLALSACVYTGEEALQLPAGNSDLCQLWDELSGKKPTRLTGESLPFSAQRALFLGAGKAHGKALALRPVQTEATPPVPRRKPRQHTLSP